MQNALIIVDEAHNFCGSTHSRDKKRDWMEFCGELRHRGNSAIQFVTQSPKKLAKEIINEAGLRQALVDAEEERDAWFGIQLSYWYELRAKLTGEYRSCFVRIDLRDVDGKKIRNHVVRLPRLQEIFALYDSFNATSKGEIGGAGRQMREYERRSWPSFVFWFVSRNASRFIRPVGIVLFIYVLLFHGGQVFGAFTAMLSGSMSPDVVESHGAGDERAAATVRDVEPAAFPFVDDTVYPPVFLRVITPDSCTLNDGVVLRVGDQIVEGKYGGYKISSIDFEKRIVVAIRPGDFSVERFVLGRLHQSVKAVGEAVDTAASVGGSESRGGH